MWHQAPLLLHLYRDSPRFLFVGHLVTPISSHPSALERHPATHISSVLCSLSFLTPTAVVLPTTFTDVDAPLLLLLMLLELVPLGHVMLGCWLLLHSSVCSRACGFGLTVIDKAVHQWHLRDY